MKCLKSNPFSEKKKFNIFTTSSYRQISRSHLYTTNPWSVDNLSKNKSGFMTTSFNECDGKSTSLKSINLKGV